MQSIWKISFNFDYVQLLISNIFLFCLENVIELFNNKLLLVQFNLKLNEHFLYQNIHYNNLVVEVLIHSILKHEYIVLFKSITSLNT